MLLLSDGYRVLAQGILLSARCAERSLVANGCAGMHSEAQDHSSVPLSVLSVVVVTANHYFNRASEPRTRRTRASKTAFAMTVGEGLDIKLSKIFAFRPVQLEYLYTRFGNDCPLSVCNNNNQNSFRLKSGVVMSHPNDVSVLTLASSPRGGP